MAEHEGKMLTIDAVVGIKGRETRATRTGLYEGQLITVLAMIGLKGKITRKWTLPPPSPPSIWRSSSSFRTGATRTTDYNGQTMTITAATGLKGKATRMFPRYVCFLGYNFTFFSCRHDAYDRLPRAADDCCPCNRFQGKRNSYVSPAAGRPSRV